MSLCTFKPWQSQSGPPTLSSALQIEGAYLTAYAAYGNAGLGEGSKGSKN